MNTYTKEQVKELLRQQRENCLEAFQERDTSGWGNSLTYAEQGILDAPEPELPKVEPKTVEKLQPYRCIDCKMEYFKRGAFRGIKR